MQSGPTARQFIDRLLTDPLALLQGFQLISDRIEQDPSFIKDSFESAVNDHNDSEKPPLSSTDDSRLASMTADKHLFWTITLLHAPLVAKFSSLSEDNQESIRNQLLSAIVASSKNLKAEAALGLLVRQIVQTDGLDSWLEPFTSMIDWMMAEEGENMEPSIEFYAYFLKETPYTSYNSEMPFYKLAPLLLSKLFEAFMHEKLNSAVKQKLLHLVYELIKTFSMHDGSNDQIVSSCFGGTFELWMSLFVSIVQGTVINNMGIKKYIFKIAVLIFRDMQRFVASKGASQVGNLFHLWTFCYRYIPVYEWCVAWGQKFEAYPPHPNATRSPDPYYDDDLSALQDPVEALAFTVLEFISVLLSLPNIGVCIKISIHHLVNSLFHLMIVTEDQLMVWRQNNLQFIASANILSSADTDSSLRTKCMSILNELIEKAGDVAIQALLIVSQKFLLNQPEEQTTSAIKELINKMVDMSVIRELTSGIFESEDNYIQLLKLSSCDIKAVLGVSGETWRKMDVALSVLARFSEDIIVFQSKQQGGFDIESYIKGLILQVQTEGFDPYLKGQCIHCLTRFTEIISIRYKELFPDMISATIQCLTQPTPVKLMACRALTIFLRKIEKHKIKLTEQQCSIARDYEPILQLCRVEATSQIVCLILEALMEMTKNTQINAVVTKPPYAYLLGMLHTNLSQTTAINLLLGLIQQCFKDGAYYLTVLPNFSGFIMECLKVYVNVVSSDQKMHLRSFDLDLISIVLKLTNIVVLAAQTQQSKLVIKDLIIILGDILASNQDVGVHVQTSICFKNIIKQASKEIASVPTLPPVVAKAIHQLLKVGKDKSFESASVYAGNLVILSTSLIERQTHSEILQEAVEKIFRSRTPSVIQSVVLIFSRLINTGLTPETPYSLPNNQAIIRLIDFLSSFSIENRMGLKILIDKWLLQQSLFRGKCTKVSTFVALSRLFLLKDKRIDNLLVIGFNPSHTNICNDVNAPLKILSTLIRSLKNEMRGASDDNDDNQEDQTPVAVAVELEKFKDEQENTNAPAAAAGGLADRENQQGSTCYMSAMLEFYDDGQECDDTTQEDLEFIKDVSTKISLAEYQLGFFQHLLNHDRLHFQECLKSLLKQDQRTLRKFIKFTD